MMDWANERYVRVYVRDTPDLLAVGWQGRALLWELMRKADRAGVVDYDGDQVLLAEMLRLPVELIEQGLPRLLARGVIEQHETALVIRNFLEAQEAAQSTAERKRASRERRLAKARSQPVTVGHAESQPVTKRDTEGTNRDPMSQPVTDGHSTSQSVTSGHSVPCRAVPCCAEDSTKRESRPRDGIACEPDAASRTLAVEHQEAISVQDAASAPLCPVPGTSGATGTPEAQHGSQGRAERTAQEWWKVWDKWGQQNVSGWRSDPVSGPVIVSRALRELRAPRDQGGSELRDADIEHAMAVMRVRGQARGRTSSEPYYAYVLCWQRPSLIVEHRQQPLPRAPRQVGRAEPSPASAFGVGGKVEL